MQLETIVNTITNIFAVTTFIFCLKTVLKLRKKDKNEITYSLRNILTTIVTGYLIWVVAEFIYTYLSLTEYVDPGTWADYLWLSGYAFTIPGFIWLCLFTFNKHKELIEETLKLALISTISLFATFVILERLIGTNPVEFDIIYLYIYPLASTLLLVLTSTTARWFIKTPLSTPFTLFAAGFAADLLGDFIYVYAQSRPVESLIPVSDSAYALGYAFTTISFYILSQRKK